MRQGPHPDRVRRQAEAKAMSEQGSSLNCIAAYFGVTLNCVRGWLQAPLPVSVKQVDVAAKEHQRFARQLQREYAAGATLAELGVKYLMSGENVRLRMNEFDDDKRPPRRIKVTVDEQTKAAQHDRRREAVKRKWGITYAQYESLRKTYGGPRFEDSPFCKYRDHKHNAELRGVPWEFTFVSWWRTWQQSGKWGARGHGHGYCMARPHDEGPYSPFNVEIISCVQNVKDGFAYRKAKKDA